MGVSSSIAPIGTAFPFIPVRDPRLPTLHDIIKMRYSVSPNGRDGTVWLIGKTVWIHLLKMQDANGRYIILESWVEPPEQLMGIPVQLTDADPYAFRIMPQVATGATQRLQVCRECHESLPDNARFCIACGVRQEEDREWTPNTSK